MHFASATAISFLTLTLTASAAAVQKRNIETGFWQLVTKPFGDSTAVPIPIVLGSEPDNGVTVQSNGGADEVPICIQLTGLLDAQGVAYKAAKVINHPTIPGDIWMWKSLGAKFLATSTRINIAGIRGTWSFVNDPNSADMLLDLNGDTVAKQSNGLMHFGSDIPAVEGGVLVSVIGVPVEAC